MTSREKFIECELRGPITWNDFNSLRNIIEEKYGPLTRVVELAMFAKGSHDFRLKINKHGIRLVFKYRAKQGEAKFEREVTIHQKDIISLIDILHHLGETQWVLSYADKFEAHKGSSSISFKFGTQVGDFFEIEELVSDKKHIPKTIDTIKKIASKLGLTLWDTDTFEKISKQSWEGVKPEPIITNQEPHELITKALVANGLLIPFEKKS